MLERLQPYLSTAAYRVAYAALTLVAAICLALLAGGRAHAAPVVDGEFALSGTPQRLAQGPDGNMWVTLSGSSLGMEVARIAPDGTVAEFNNDSLAGAVGIAAGPDQQLWVTVSLKVVRFDPNDPTAPGTPFAADIAGPQTIVAGPDGNLWTASGDKAIRIAPAGAVTQFPVLGQARGIASAGGLLWVADFGGNAIVSVTTDGTPTPYPIGSGPQEVAGGLNGQVGFTNPTPPHRVGRLVAGGSPLQTEVAPGTDPFGIAFGADQAYWIAQPFGNNLGRLTADGQYSQLGGFSAEAGPRYIAAGPGNTLWVALQGTGGQANTFNKVGRISGLKRPAPAPVPTSPTKPAISKLKLSKKRFRVGKGTTIGFTLNVTANIRISFQRKAAGRRSGGRCVKPKPRLRLHKRCKRWVKTGKALTRRGLSAGAQKIAFSGRIGRSALKPGSYRLTVVATNASGAKSKPRRTTFTVIAPPRP